MSAVEPLPAPPLLANRAHGVVRARFTAVGGRTGTAQLFQGGGLRLRSPRVSPGLVPDHEAVLINTAGGMMGGDHATLAFTCEAGAAVTLTTQSAEKIYRASGRPTTVDTTLTLGSGTRTEWLPQETILFDRADFHRRLTVDMAADARLLLAETLVFGRIAMGEAFQTGIVRDRWRVQRAGRLVFAEEVELGPDAQAQLDRAALGAGARAAATLLLVEPGAEDRLDTVRAALADSPCPGGASSWNGLLLARLLSPSPAALRAAMVGLLAALRGRAAPRVWQ